VIDGYEPASEQKTGAARPLDPGSVRAAVDVVGAADGSGGLASGNAGHGSAGARWHEPPGLQSPLSSAEVVERLSRQSKKGKLPGFRLLHKPASERDEGAVRLLVFGGIYDHEMLVRVVPAASGVGSDLGMRVRLLRKMPAAAIAILVLTVFPGMYLTDSMLSTYFEWYTIETWWWYMPLVALMLPVMWKQYTQARAEAQREASELREKLGQLVEAPGASAPAPAKA
jgi:hypothetical protein